MYQSITFHISNFNGHLLLPYKFSRPVDCKLQWKEIIEQAKTQEEL